MLRKLAAGIVLFSLAGCGGTLDTADQKVAETLSGAQAFAGEKLDAAGDWATGKANELADRASDAAAQKFAEIQQKTWEKLGALAHQKIDEWLAAQGLNAYGDPAGTAYLGGTPLFDESTGETQDRLAILLEKHPELAGIIADLESGSTAE